MRFLNRHTRKIIIKVRSLKNPGWSFLNGKCLYEGAEVDDFSPDHDREIALFPFVHSSAVVIEMHRGILIRRAAMRVKFSSKMMS